MKILHVTCDPPYPLYNGGAVAVFNRLRWLKSRGHRVDLYCPTIRPVSWKARQALADQCAGLRLYPVSNRAGAVAAMLRPSWPFRTVRRYSAKMRREIERVIRSGSVDLVIVEHSNMVCYLPDKVPASVRTILVFEAIVHKAFARDSGNVPWIDPRRLLYKREAWLTRKIEQAVLDQDRFDEYWFYSAHDAQEVVADYPGLARKVRIIAVGVETPKCSPNRKFSGKTVVMLGSMDNPSNEDAARWFVERVWPAVRREVPDARFLVVGGNSKAKLKDLSVPGMAVLGEVPDPRPYLESCQVYVVPQRGGAGVRIKLLDGLAAGCVVVSTPVGVEALPDLKPGEHYLLAQGADDFAAHVIEILREPGKFLAIGVNAAALARKKFSIEAVGQETEHYLTELLRKRGEKKPAVGL